MAYGDGMQIPSETLEKSQTWLGDAGSKALELLANWAPAFGTVAFVVVGLLSMHRLLLGKHDGAEKSLPRQLGMLALTILGLVLIVLSLPFESDLRGQMLSLLGLVFTAVIALSSPTIVANAMGGLQLRAVKSFRLGDFIHVGANFGRVTERTLFHTEIQTEDRDLVTLPNLYVVTNPVRVIRASGTVISVKLSLGYDVPRDLVEDALKSAAAEIGLADPFVHLIELGDFSVTYKAAGFLADVESLITTRSRLGAAVVDALHEAGVEIVSPTFMNQRALDPSVKILAPSARKDVEDPGEATTETVAFDKADQAGGVEVLRDELAALEAKLEAAPSADLKARRDALAERIAAAVAALAES